MRIRITLLFFIVACTSSKKEQEYPNIIQWRFQWKLQALSSDLREKNSALQEDYIDTTKRFFFSFYLDSLNRHISKFEGKLKDVAEVKDSILYYTIQSEECDYYGIISNQDSGLYSIMKHMDKNQDLFFWGKYLSIRDSIFYIGDLSVGLPDILISLDSIKTFRKE